MPAKIIKYRFSPEIIEELLALKWWDLPLELLDNVPFDNIEDSIKLLNERKKINPELRLEPKIIGLTSKLKIIT